MGCSQLFYRLTKKISLTQLQKTHSRDEPILSLCPTNKSGLVKSEKKTYKKPQIITLWSVIRTSKCQPKRKQKKINTHTHTRLDALLIYTGDR